MARSVFFLFLNLFHPLSLNKDEDAMSELNNIVETKSDEQVKKLLADLDQNFLFQAIDVKHKKVCLYIGCSLQNDVRLGFQVFQVHFFPLLLPSFPAPPLPLPPPTPPPHGYAFQTVIRALTERKVKAGEYIIRQGDSGDFYYIIDSGKFAVYVRSEDDSPGASEFLDGEEKVVLDGSGSFGELALL